MLRHLRVRLGEILAIIVGRENARPDGKKIAEVFGKTFVDPEELACHWLVIITGGQTSRTAKFTVPRVNEFVRHQRGNPFAARVFV